MGKHKKITYLLSQFPETHETFITREITALQKGGWDVQIISLKPCRDRILYPDSIPLQKQTWYVEPLFSWQQMTRFGRAFIRSPLLFVRFLSLFVVKQYKEPGNLFKSLYTLLQSLAISTALMKRPPTHIHAHWANVPTTAALVLSRVFKVSYSFTAHAWDIFLADRLLKVKLDRANFVLTCTDYNRKHLLEKYAVPQLADKLFLNYHGVELERLQPVAKVPAPAKPIVLFSIGRLVEQKGFGYLIDACAILQAQGHDFTCTIVGDGPLKKELENKIRTQRLHGRFFLAGAKPFDEILQLFRSADFFVMPSVIARDGDRDGIPNVLLEAMALGVPVIASQVSGIPELVQHGVNGFLVEPNNAQDLADKIILAQRMDRPTMTRQARITIEQKFDIEKNVAALMAVFNTRI
jgi:colanic acid/amylovoran biosynthesis glycosyltransferase